MGSLVLLGYYNPFILLYHILYEKFLESFTNLYNLYTRFKTTEMYYSPLVMQMNVLSRNDAVR